MMRVLKTLKTAALVGMVGCGLVVATPAKADHVVTRCDRDGDRCYRVVCDWDGDDCRRLPTHTSWYGDDRYRDERYRYGQRYYDPDRDRFYRYHHYDHRTGIWVCDGSSEYCRWSARRW